ncbi:hypothetical protein DMH18_37065 [Streptomyces sp. WAC 06783]|uniref:hypothetical protein n=1 Tax=Streptomyces sp. WAC 06783 TaxID=2203211 RepID=UPI000F74B790|nr:hypothetical protein [Streptomyces sp. WAC 06783]RSO03578.1 hypothetical protein DMH18_37065 [Streptomyces sp. WAC 06783]
MTETALEKARKAAEAAATKLVDLEHQEAEKAARKNAERAEKEYQLAVKFLEDRVELEAEVKGIKPSVDEVATAFETGALAAMVAEHLARRDAINSLRAHAQHCATLVGEDVGHIPELRYIDPVEELRRWQDDAMTALRRKRADDVAAEVLAAYEVD